MATNEELDERLVTKEHLEGELSKLAFALREDLRERLDALDEKLDQILALLGDQGEGGEAADKREPWSVVIR